MNKLQLACLTATAFVIINSPIAPQTQDISSLLNYSPEAQAKGKGGGGGSSGGRSRGGSFNQSAPSKSGNNSGNSSGNSSRNGSNNNAPNNAPTYDSRGYIPSYGVPVYVNPNPVIVTNGSSSSDGGGFLAIIFLIIIGGGSIALLIWWLSRRKKAGSKSGLSELTNEIVTVTCLQVALLAEAREIQSHLIDLATEADLTTPAGLTAQLQESVLALLRTPENWTHGRSTSQTVANIKSAETLFERMSIAERQKFATETLVNVGGKVRRQLIDSKPEPDIAEYIVVTLLVGTADDQPLFPTIHSEEDLKAALTRLAAISPEYLMVFELLWTPTEKGDSLTYDQLLANYADMRQLV